LFQNSPNSYLFVLILLLNISNFNIIGLILLVLKKMDLSSSKGKGKVVESHGFDPNFQPETFTIPSTGYHIEISDDDDGGAQPHTQTQEGVQNQGNIGEERKGRALKSNMFTKHFTKVTWPSGEVRAKCNYCTNSYACKKRMGYGSLKQHMENHHAVEYGLDRKQMQIISYVSSTTGNTLGTFKHFEQIKKN
jgi:hypothetical protein